PGERGHSPRGGGRLAEWSGRSARPYLLASYAREPFCHGGRMPGRMLPAWPLRAAAPWGSRSHPMSCGSRATTATKSVTPTGEPLQPPPRTFPTNCERGRIPHTGLLPPSQSAPAVGVPHGRPAGEPKRQRAEFHFVHSERSIHEQRTFVRRG